MDERNLSQTGYTLGSCKLDDKQQAANVQIIPWRSCGEVTALTHLCNTAVVVIIPSSDLNTETFQ